jgi:hypothetical protein
VETLLCERTENFTMIHIQIIIFINDWRARYDFYEGWDQIWKAHCIMIHPIHSVFGAPKNCVEPTQKKAFPYLGRRKSQITNLGLRLANANEMGMLQFRG